MISNPLSLPSSLVPTVLVLGLTNTLNSDPFNPYRNCMTHILTLTLNADVGEIRRIGGAHRVPDSAFVSARIETRQLPYDQHGRVTSTAAATVFGRFHSRVFRRVPSGVRTKSRISSSFSRRRTGPGSRCRGCVHGRRLSVIR